MTSSLRKVRRGKDLSLLTRYTHTFWKATSAIQADGCHYHFLIWILRSDPFCRQNPCSFCNILPFNFVPTPNKSLRFRGFRRSSGNHPVFVVANHYQSCTAFFCLMYAVQSVTTFLFLQLFVLSESVSV